MPDDEVGERISDDERTAPAAAPNPPKRSRGRPPNPVVKGKTAYHASKKSYRTDAEVFAEIERMEGEAEPVLVMMLLRSHRALEATNRAQRDMIRMIGDELVKLKSEKKKGSR